MNGQYRDMWREGGWYVATYYPSICQEEDDSSLCLIKHCTMMYGDVEVKFHSVLTLTLDRGELSDTSPSQFSAGKEAPVPIAHEAG